MDITQSVYESLETSANEIGKSVAERDTLNELIKSGRYSQQTLRDEIYPKRDTLNRKIEMDSADAMKRARDLIAQYREETAKAQTLNPADLTDDAKLLQPGITLLPRDIQAMLERNAGNRTMTQIILRYAKEHNIDTGGTLYIGGQQEEATARSLENILFYFEKYLSTKDANRMLRTFFNVTE